MEVKNNASRTLAYKAAFFNFMDDLCRLYCDVQEMKNEENIELSKESFRQCTKNFGELLIRINWESFLTKILSEYYESRIHQNMVELKYDFYHELAKIVDEFKNKIDNKDNIINYDTTAEDTFWEVVRKRVDEQCCLEVTTKKLLKIK